MTGIEFYNDIRVDLVIEASQEVTMSRAWCAAPFRPTRYDLVPNINYAAFRVERLQIGHEYQNHETLPKDSFTAFRERIDVVMAGLLVSLTVRNISESAQPFCVGLVGEVLR